MIMDIQGNLFFKSQLYEFLQNLITVAKKSD